MSKTEDEFYAELALIADETITHELDIRNVDPQRGPLVNRRKQLARELFNEQTDTERVLLTVLNPMNDLKACRGFIDRYEKEINDLTATSDMRQKAIANLNFIERRVKRVKCTNDDESELAQLLLKSIGLLTKISDKSSETAHGGAKSKNIGPNGPQQQQQNDPKAQPSTPFSQQQSTPNAQSTQANEFLAQMFTEFRNLMTQNRNNNAPQPRVNKIHKWNIKFTGEKHADVFEFLRKVKSKAQSHGVSNDELFVSAGEFFSDFAAKWFFSQKFRNWTDLSERLVSDFVQVNYFDELLDTIRQRRQSPNQTIVHFFTVFEDDCSRLKDPLPTAEKVKIIKKNVLQKYRPYIALANFHTMDEIKHALKILEATMPQSFGDSHQFKRFNSGDRLQQVPDNTSKGAHQSRYEKFTDGKQVDFKRDRSNSNNPVRSNFSRENSRENWRRNNSNDRRSRENSQNRNGHANQSFRNSSGSRAENKNGN